MTKVKAFGERILGKMISPPDLYKKSKSGLLVADKDMTTGAIKPRWFEITSVGEKIDWCRDCLLYTSPSPRDGLLSRMPSSA